MKLTFTTSFNHPSLISEIPNSYDDEDEDEEDEDEEDEEDEEEEEEEEEDDESSRKKSHGKRINV